MIENPAEMDLDALVHTAFAERAFQEHPGLKLETVGGTKIDPFDLRAGDVDVADVAFSLSNICRWHGHVDRSVLEHSLDVMEFVRAEDEPVATQFAALVHDAQEYVLNDLARGVKQKPSMAAYREAEARAVSTLRALWGIESSDARDGTIKRADDLVMFLEADRWIPSRGRSFSSWTPEMQADVERHRGEFPAKRVASKAGLRRMFLHAFANLRRGRAGGGIIVGLTGYKESGKDTFGGVLCREGGFERVTFADPIKQECAEFVGETVEEMEKDKKKWRHLWQSRGQSMREKSETHWIKRIYARLDDGIDAGIDNSVYTPSFVITDVRHPNEAEFIREYATRRGMEALIVRVRRADQPAMTEDQHESERSVDDFLADRQVTTETIEDKEQAARDFLSGKWDEQEK